MSSKRSTIYLLAEMGREAACSREEAEQALLKDCPEEAEFIRMILDELYLGSVTQADPRGMHPRGPGIGQSGEQGRDEA